MTPTAFLRFVERTVERPIPGTDYAHVTSEKILQQWWEDRPSINLGWTGDIPITKAKGEWRDVETVKE